MLALGFLALIMYVVLSESDKKITKKKKHKCHCKGHKHEKN